MGSRLKQNPEQTFYWFFQATCPVARDKDPGVLFQFPEDFSDEESSQTLPRFCFPYDIGLQRSKEAVSVQHFTFVLTDLEGCQRFGFCRLTNHTHTCLCMLSYLPWFEVFYKLLNNLADYLSKGQTNEMKALLAALYTQPLPLAAGSVTLQMVPYFIAPDPRSLPSIPENRNLTEMIVAVDVGNLLQLYASMLFERRILIFASKLSTLTSCVHALSAMLYPMYWQHIFIPVLPPHLLDYCCAPMPYLIGVHASLSERVRSRGLEEVVILNVDTNSLENPFDDLKRIPSDVMSGLKVCLKRQAVSPGCGVSRAFLKAQALLFGGYRDALQGEKEGEVWFSEELFVEHKSSSMRHFLENAIHLQSFKQFIEGRLDILNKGKEPDDLYEEEILKCETTAGRSKSYQQLVGNLKKGGGALILNMKSKANMRAKGLTKSGFKNLLLHKTQNEEVTLHRGGSVKHRRAQSDCLQNRLPITQHFGRSRPRRPVHKRRSPGDEEDVQDTGETWDGAGSGPVVELESELQKDEEDGEDPLLCDPEEMDLLGEIFDTLSSRSSNERGLLYATRSLDLFGPDSHDYIRKGCFPANPSQESLSLSISGSGSLHSWNVETMEEQSDLTEDSDSLCLDTSVPEEDRTESPLAVCDIGQQKGGQQEEVKVAINGNKEEEIDGGGNFKEVKLEEETKEVGQEKRVSLGEEQLIGIGDNREDEGLNEERESEQRQRDEVAEGQELEEVTNEMQKGEAKGEEGKEQEKDDLNKLNRHHPNAAEEQQELGDNLEPTSGLQSLIVDPEPPEGPVRSREEAGEKQEQDTKQTPSSPEVVSAETRVQSQVKTRIQERSEPERPCNTVWSRETTQTHPPCDSNISEKKNASKTGEDKLPLIKVSELKKRFEA
ncbi:DENN domain-containing protein 1B isoform X4 [Pseudochaenichthys georgianus]|uniref:DENN domain-containing protein 1B isoform X4 n=1 Tax=Pseudochaenichthys georgianus TaxID=52239 RepID=UPI001469EEE9|nr:DENN domain-containing protein 1B isoform X4 [Pseudochaenichthys georgianus]